MSDPRPPNSNHDLYMLLAYGDALDAERVAARNAAYPRLEPESPWTPDGRILPVQGLSAEIVLAWNEPTTVAVYRPIWPAGILHRASRFAHGWQHCEACGKHIPSGEFVPMYAHDRRRNAPVSMWLGRDCARRIFGIRDLGITREEGT